MLTLIPLGASCAILSCRASSSRTKSTIFSVSDGMACFFFGAAQASASSFHLARIVGSRYLRCQSGLERISYESASMAISWRVYGPSIDSMVSSLPQAPASSAI